MQSFLETTVGLLYVAMASIIYFDATRHKIGKIKGERATTNMHAGGWAFCLAIPWWWLQLIVLVSYLSHRKRLIGKAKEHPVALSYPHRIFITGIIFMLSYSLLYCANYAHP